MIIWLKRSPHKYPFIPIRGIQRRTPAIRIANPRVFMMSEVVAFPSPFIMLIKVEFRYKKGQIKDKVFK